MEEIKEDVNNKEEKNKKKKWLILLLLLLLFIIIIILLHIFFWCKKPTDVLGIKEENSNNTTDNNIVTNTTIDNNEVDNSNNNTCNDDYYVYAGNSEQNVNNVGDNEQQGETTKPQEDEEQPEVKEFKVTSKGEKITEDLSIFDNVKYNGKAVIYPGISNTYYFEISNTLDFNVNCKVSFAEENIENLPIRYRLKENGQYIAGNENTYVSYNELNFDRLVNSNSQNNYELDWKWVEGNNDNQYGDLNKTITYKIQLTVEAEQQTED